MATSGTITFTQTRDQIITDTLMLLGVVGSGETANSNDISLCSNLLNKMIKSWEGQGIHLWTESEGTLFLTNGQSTYLLQAGSNGAKASDGTGTPVETTLSSSASGGTSTLSVTTATGMSVNDNIGICLDANTIQWTTISAISGTTITLNAALTSAATSGNAVYTYTTQCPRVLSIQSVRLRDSSGNDRQIKLINRQEYMRIVNKSISSIPTVCYASCQLNNTVIYLWPTPNNVSQRLEFTYLRALQDVNSSTDNLDFPQEWLNCITYNLAVMAAPAFGINLATGGITGNPNIVTMAAQMLDSMMAWDSEQPYITLVPNYRNS